MSAIFYRVGKFFRRGEPGFTMVVVLVALLMLSVLGAASLLLMVSSMEGVVNIVPEQRAFLIAEAGLFIAHTFIVEKGTEAAPFRGSVLGGEFEVDIRQKEGSKSEFVVTSSGSYTKGGTTYRRKIREEVLYTGEQTYDVLRNYIFFAGRDLRMEIYGLFEEKKDRQLVNFDPIVIDGAMRAENDVIIKYYCQNASGDALVCQGSPIRANPNELVSVEAGNSVYIEAAGRNKMGQGMHHSDWPSDNPYDVDGVNVQFYGDIRAGSDVTLKVWSGLDYAEASTFPHQGNGEAAIFAAAYGPNESDDKWRIVSPSLNEYVAAPYDEKGDPHDRLFKGEYHDEPGVQRVYIPKPNYDYYKLLAMEQGNYYDVGPNGTKEITGPIVKSGISSMTVFYSTGNMVLGANSWQDPNTNGVFVCEGDFVATNETGMKEHCTMQVIAKGDVTFDSKWSGKFADPLTNTIFLYAGRDARLCMTRFSKQNIQITALRDLILTSEQSWSFTRFYYRPPQIDVAGWPIDIVILNWMELPVD